MIMPLCDYVSPATTALGRQADCWEDAVRQAGALLEKAGAIDVYKRQVYNHLF